MYYMIYLGCMFLLLYGAACTRIITSSLCFVPSQLLNYFDLKSIVFILIPCLLVLFCTKSFRSFGRSFLLMFGKERSITKDSLYSLGAVMGTAVIAGAFHSILLMLGMAVSGGGVPNPMTDLFVSLLSPLYSLILCLILLPVLVSVWKHVRAAVAYPQGHK